MNKRVIYDFFIGLIALMLSLIFIIDIFITIPKSVQLTFYYIDNFSRLIFLGDYIFRFSVDKNKRKFSISNLIDLLSIISIKTLVNIIGLIKLQNIISPNLIIKFIKLFKLSIYILKFRDRVAEEITKNKFYYLLVMSTVVIVVGAVIISLIEGISIGDALWWSFVTFTTVGYGDVLLKTQLGKAIAVILMILGIGVIGVATTSLTLFIVNGKKGRENKSYKDKMLTEVKEMIDNYDDLSSEDIDYICKLLRMMKK